MVEQKPRLGDVETTVALEAPRIETDREVIYEKVIAGEIKVDQAGKFATQKKYVVGK